MSSKSATKFFEQKYSRLFNLKYKTFTGQKAHDIKLEKNGHDSVAFRPKKCDH